jgi:hypothetical protein
MEKTPQYVKEVQALLAQIDNNESSQDKQPLDTNPPDNDIDVYIEDFAEEERITLIRKKPYSMPVTREEEESELTDLGMAPRPSKSQPQPVANAALGVWLLGLLIPLFCIAVQLYFIVNPFTDTVTLYTRSQQESVTGTLLLGRVISPLTLSQSQTVQTTGRGHQDARAATGSITFYNGQFTAITIPAGTTFTGSDGIQVVTDEDAVIPAASPNPPVFGQVPVSAHVTSTGAQGNIAAYDINQTCCATSILVKNTAAFHGGQDERNFQTVAPSDITNTAAPLKATLNQSMQNIVSGQLKSGEAITAQHCTPTTTADYQAGQEAKEIKVTVSETCSAIAYNSQELISKVTQLLTAQAQRHLGTGYSMLDAPQVQVTQAAAQNSKVVLSFEVQSTWVYALTTQEQQHLKKLIAGKTTATALQLLTALPGIERVSLQSSGFGDSSRIPKALSSIHLALFYGL